VGAVKLNSGFMPSAWQVPSAAGIVGVTMLLGIGFAWALANEHYFRLALIILVALIPAFVRWPVASTFGVYAFLIPFNGVAAFADLGGATVLRFVGILTGAVLFAAGLVERRLCRPPRAALWWGLFVVWAILSVAWAIDPDSALRRMPTMLSLFFLYVAAVSVKPRAKELYIVCLLAVVGAAIAGVLGYAYGIEQTADASRRGTLALAGQKMNPNWLGQTLVGPLMLALAGLVGVRSAVHKVTAAVLVGAIAAGIGISMSRGAMLAIVVAMSLLVFRLGPRKEMIVAALLMVATAATMPDLFYDRVGALFTGEDATGSGRTGIWDIGVQALWRYGAIGAGLENFQAAHASYVPFGPRGEAPGAHNTFLTVWVELGIVGLLLMLLAFKDHVAALRDAWKAHARNILLPGLEAACLGTLILAFFADNIWTKDFWLPWILLSWAVHHPSDVRQVGDD
jgi:O-antigen ligase